mmetsp:Transcript_3474/g.7208  ORF Transcript_3474/g.7208 Transcript_3474/m.7208 type:complete len:206 (+) Transcript_3474:109-726(+)
MLSNFTKLISAEMQHTFVENEAVRYVFQPLENIYLVLVTSKNSNIVEDLETLRLLQKVIQHYCAFGVDDGNILKYSFEIIWAFDDVVSLGYRESVTLGQVLTYTAMESAEERLHKEKLKQQMNDAKKFAKQKQKELDRARAAETHRHEPAPASPLPSFPPPSSEVKETPPQDLNETSVSTSSSKRPTKRGMQLTTKGHKGMFDDY